MLPGCLSAERRVKERDRKEEDGKPEVRVGEGTVLESEEEKAQEHRRS